MDEVFIPVTFFAAVAVIVGLRLYFGYRVQADRNKTIRAVIESGQQISPQVLKDLSDSSRSPEADFRRGIVAISIGIAIAVIGALAGNEIYERWTVISVGCLPLILGIAYLALWKLSSRD